MDKDTSPIGSSDWVSKYNLKVSDTVPCDTKACKQEATHYTQVRCCGAVVMGCKECLTNVFRITSGLIYAHQPVNCVYCGAMEDPSGWLSRPLNLRLTKAS